MVHLKSVLAANVRNRRKALSMTQEKLAELINTSPTYIAMIESEKRTPSFNMIERMAAALNIDPPGLFSMDNYPSESSSQIHQSLIKQFDLFLRAAGKEMRKE